MDPNATPAELRAIVDDNKTATFNRMVPPGAAFPLVRLDRPEVSTAGRPRGR